MLFSKVGVYKADQEGSYIVELGHEANDSVHPIHRSSPLPMDEAKNLLRHVQVPEREIEQRLRRAIPAALARSAAS